MFQSIKVFFFLFSEELVLKATAGDLTNVKRLINKLTEKDEAANMSGAFASMSLSEPNKTSNLATTALIAAAKAGQTQCALALLELGGKPNVEDSNKKTAFDYARNNGFMELEDRMRLYGTISNSSLVIE